MPARCARSDRQGDACASPTSRGYLYRRQRRIARDAPTKRRARRGRLVAATPRWLTHPRALQGARGDVGAHAEERAREMASRSYYAAEKRTRRLASRCTRLTLGRFSRRPPPDRILR